MIGSEFCGKYMIGSTFWKKTHNWQQIMEEKQDW